MAFNPLNTFHKNKRFWMAMILGICMVSFVFCTGMRGGMDDRFLGWFRRSGKVVARVADRNVTSEELYELKKQRNIANDYMRICLDVAFKRLSKKIYDDEKIQGADKEKGKDLDKRRQSVVMDENMRQSLVARKDRPRYFDTGTKFDDLLEFKLWQAQADQMGIQIEEEHVKYLFRMEFFYNREVSLLDDQDLSNAQNEVRRTFQNITPTMIIRAIAEEFRVKMAQLAVMEAQPFSFWYRQSKNPESFAPKFTVPDVPDEIRTPLTLAQVWDAYKRNRSEFDVKLIPVPVEEFVKSIGAPNPDEERNYFNEFKNKPYSPSQGEMGLEIPAQIKIEYLMPDMKAYVDLAKTIAQLKYTNPIAMDLLPPGMAAPLTSYLTAGFTAIALDDQRKMERQYQSEVSQPVYRLAAPFSAADWQSPIYAWYARHHPQAGASLVASSYLTPFDPFGALSGYLSWGAVREANDKDEARRGELKPGTTRDGDAALIGDVKEVLKAEMIRRAPIYMSVFASGTTDSPLGMVSSLLCMDGRDGPATPLLLPVEAVRKELKGMLASRQAEEWARDSMQTVRKKLEDASGDEEKFKRVLNEYVPKLHLKLEPPAEARQKYFDRYTIDKAKEFEPLKEAYLKYMDRINFFEGRDTTPATLLKPDDFYKMFFDSSEQFSATARYRAMPWPPVVTPSNIRVYKGADPRLINSKKIDGPTFQNFSNFIKHQDPNRQAPPFDLFLTADEPMLFWRTAEANPQRPADYDKIDKELAKNSEKLKEIRQGLAKFAPDSDEYSIWTKKEADLKKTDSDLVDLKKRIQDGWKFDRARATLALPKAQAIATAIIKSANNPIIVALEADALKQNVILLPNVSPMKKEQVREMSFDYEKYTLPKDVIEYARPDMAQQIVSLYDLKKPIEIKDAELDKVNKELFDLVSKEKNPQEERSVQIFTNKPRSVYYVAVVSRLPRAEAQGFYMAMLGASPEMKFFHDPFITRAQQEDAKQWRAAIVADLGRVLGYADVSAEARKEFDERAAGD